MQAMSGDSPEARVAVVLGVVVANRSGDHFSRSIAAFAARSALIAAATD